VSALYAYSQHGDPYVRSLVTHLLNQVGKLTLAQFLVHHHFQGEDLGELLMCGDVR